jgi:kinetochore protein Spc7/SPC105
MNFNNPDEAFSSSPLSDASSADDVDEVVEEDDISNSDDSDDADGTAMSIDGGETTDMSLASMKSASSTGSNTRLDEALRQAARQAGTQGIDFDENGDDMDEGEEVVASFAPWAKPNPGPNLEAQQDQENVNPFSPAFKAGAAQQEEPQSDGEDMTMDMTKPVGGIMPGQQPDEDEISMDVTRAFGGIIQNEASKPATRRKSTAASRRQSTRRRSSGEDSNGDETMEFTMAVGGIQSAKAKAESDDDEDMTMEFTSVVGGVLPPMNPSRTRSRASLAPQSRGQKKRSRESMDSNMGDDTMDMTAAVGGIMPSIAESGPEEQDATMGMEMTTALGGILQPQRSTGSRSQAKKVMEIETDLASSPFQAEVLAKSPPKVPAPMPAHTVASETGSPSLNGFRGKGLRRSTEARRSTTPKSKLGGGSTPIKKPATPTKLTPQLARPTTPSKTPPPKNVAVRSASPKRLFKEEIQASSSTPQSAKGSAKGKKAATPSKLFTEDKTTGSATPNFILTPQARRSSGIGLDREGLGSPRVAALLDRRVSIGDQAKSFVPGQLDVGRGVRFDPRAMEEEIDKEREQEEDRENGRSILEREVDQGEEKDATLNLKDLIQSLTPKRNPLKGRKSLHVGAAKGILGKRPAELDEDDEDEDNGGVKRLKNHQGSPVKNVKLQGPPTKLETTGRMTRAARKSLEEANNASTPTMSSPPKAKATTPRGQGRFKDVEVDATAQVGPLAEKKPVEDPEVSEESFEDDRIQLQDFLNMTSIRFMELTTTKRRHTLAPKLSTGAKGQKDEGEVGLEDCVAAGAATIPMLELFQHVSLIQFSIYSRLT